MFAIAEGLACCCYLETSMHKRKQIKVLLGGMALLLAGCASLREKVDFKMSAEQEQLEPHESRREELRRMARPE